MDQYSIALTINCKNEFDLGKDRWKREMSRKYYNRKKVLEEDNCRLLTRPEEFLETNIFRLECKNGHVTEQKDTSLNNRIGIWKRGECPSLCGKCCVRDPIIKKLEARFQELGFQLIKLHEDNITVEYRCKCGGYPRRAQAVYTRRRDKIAAINVIMRFRWKS